MKKVEVDLVPQERSKMKILLIIAIILGTAGIAWFIVKQLEREHRRHELAMKNMSFMESLHLTGLPIICFTNNGKIINMILDTGSNVCIIDSNILKDITYEKGRFQIDGIVGIGGEASESEAVELTLTYKDLDFKVECYSNDLAETAIAIKQEYGVTVHGLLGTDFFSKYKYVIDFNSMVAYSLRIH